MAKIRKHHASRPMEAVLNEILHYFRQHATSQDGDQFGRWEGSLDGAIGTVLNLPKRHDGRHAGATTYSQPLRWLKVVTPLRRATAGGAAIRSGATQPAAYQIDMRRRITRDDVLRWRLHTAEQQRELKERKRREERAAGDTPDTTTGGPVETRHFHAGTLDHAHPAPEYPGGERSGPHWHDGELANPGKPRWTDDGRASRVEYRHHTHQAKPDETNGVRPAVTEELTGTPAMLLQPETDGRYRALLDIIAELETKLSAATHREEENHKEIRRLTRELEDLARYFSDPTTQEADEVLARYGKQAP